MAWGFHRGLNLSTFDDRIISFLSDLYLGFEFHMRAWGKNVAKNKPTLLLFFKANLIWFPKAQFCSKWFSEIAHACCYDVITQYGKGTREDTTVDLFFMVAVQSLHKGTLIPADGFRPFRAAGILQ